MAKRQVEVLEDDLDGTLIMDENEGRTVSLAFDGQAFELDLTNDHIRELENSLARFIGQASSPVRATRNGTSSVRANPEDLQAIRTWARENGYEVKERGRIPFSIMDAFAKAHARRAPRR
jgi:hypothetical protein